MNYPARALRRVELSDILEQPVAVEAVGWGRPADSGAPVLDIVETFVAYPDITRHPGEFVLLTDLLDLIGAGFGLSEAARENLYVLALEWNGTWSQVIVAAMTL